MRTAAQGEAVRSGSAALPDNLADAVQASARQTPSGLAPLEHHTGATVTWRAFDRAVEAFATRLLARGFRRGDVIHAVNRTEIDGVEALRQVIQAIESRAPVALQFERQGRLAYLAFEME